MQNLREKLLKAGLVSEDQAKSSEKTAAERRPASQPSQPSQPSRAPQGHRPDERRFEPRRPEGRRPDERRFESRRPAEKSAPIPKLPPLAVPNNKEFQRLEAKKQVELDRRLRELVMAAQVEVEPGEHTFYFVTRKNRLRRISMTPGLAQRLESGELAVVERPEPAQIEHSIVPAETARQVMALSERAVRFFNQGERPIGFMSDEELSRRQKAEAEAPEAEAPEAEAPEAEAPGAGESPAAEASTGEEQAS